MNTTYSVSWKTGTEGAVAGLLEITPDGVHFAPANGGAESEVPFADVPAVRRHSSTVVLERQSGDPIRIDSVAAALFGPRLEAAVAIAETLCSLRAEHDRVDEELGALRVAVRSLAELGDARGREVVLLATDLMRRVVRHAQVEERDLYPAVVRLLGGEPLVEAMVFDHRAVEGEVCELIRIDPDDRRRLTCQFDRLDALLTTHIAKEEAIVFPMLERAASAYGTRSLHVVPPS